MTTTAQKVIDKVLIIDDLGEDYFGKSEFISIARNEAPKLARALAVALRALDNVSNYKYPFDEADRALSQINQIFGADDEKA